MEPLPRAEKLPSPQERLELILLGLARREPVTALCRQASVSRELFYRWMRAVREAALKALEAKAPGPKAVPPEKAPGLARKLDERVDQELRGLRKDRDHWRLLAETAKRIVQRNAWGPVPEPGLLKKRHAKPETRELYRREWAAAREHEAPAQVVAWCWGLSRSMHWRWTTGRVGAVRRRVMKVTAELKGRVLALDRTYRSTWDVHAIAYVVKLSATTVAKILRELRGPRPKRAKHAHTRRTRFLRRDVMWSSDFADLLWGWKLIRTIDEMTGYRLGWDLCRGETAEAAVESSRMM